MDKLPLVRVSEVAFLASNVGECLDFYRRIGMLDLPASPHRLNFAHVGKQLYGICDDKTGFLDPWTGSYGLRSIELRKKMEFTPPLCKRRRKKGRTPNH